jgi:type II secretory pathway pseudopilin PulG
VEQWKHLRRLTGTEVVMLSRANRTPVQAAVSAAIPRRSQATRLPLQYPRLRNERGFTLAELLVSVGVLVLLVLLATQLLNSAVTITTLGHKQMDADSQARQLLDRIAVDFAQMVKRSDVDYFAKGTAAPNSVGGTTAGNDQIAFYSMVPGYYPASGSQSPVSLVAYRVKSQNKLERLGKGLVWNGVSPADTPVVFLPLLISNMWPYATNQSPDPNSASAYETMGSQVFRFEYYYLLKNGGFSDTPWDTNAGHTVVNGMQDVSAIVVDIAVIDPKSKVLLTDANIATFATPGAANFLSDYASGMVPGQLRAQWQNTLNGITSLPRPALSGIRLYERFFYLSPPVL